MDVEEVRADASNPMTGSAVIGQRGTSSAANAWAGDCAARTSADVAGDYDLTASIVDRLDASLMREIDALARIAIEPNVYHESWMLAAALEYLNAPELTLVLVRHGSHALTGLFPLQASRRFRGLPLPSLRSWQHDYLPLGSPLIAAGHVAGTLAALLDWVGSDRAPASILDLVSVRADGPVAEALAAEIRRRKHCAVHGSLRERALLDLRAPAGTGISGKHRKEMRRQERRLAELGEIHYRVLAQGEPAEMWIKRFLAVELRGWKGAQGTAMDVGTGSRAFFSRIAEQAHRRGQLHMLELTLDGTTIAAKCSLTSGEGAFMFKIAYDQQYAKYSPGLLLELFNMDFLHSPTCSGLAWADSCAKSQHFMIERLWPQRRLIGYYSICSRGLVARNVVRHGHRINAIWQRLRAPLRGN